MENSISINKYTDLLFKKILDESNNKKNRISLLSGQGSSIISIIISINNNNKNYLIPILNKLIDRILETIEIDESPSSSYCNGLAGIGWLFLYLIEKEIIKIKSKDFFLDIDSFLKKHLKYLINKENLDLLHGGLGIGLYFLKRRNFEVVESLLFKITEIITDDDGRLSLSYYDPYNLKTDVYDFGLAHGHSGVLYFLNKCEKAGMKNHEIKKLKNGIIKFFLYNIKRHSDHSYFPTVIAKFDYNNLYQKKESRLGWCYGDLTILYTLLGTSIQDKNDVLRVYTEEALTNLVQRKRQKETNIKDPFFCHGTSGVGYIFLKIFHITGNDIFLRSANYWFEETLKYIEGIDLTSPQKTWPF